MKEIRIVASYAQGYGPPYDVDAQNRTRIRMNDVLNCPKISIVIPARNAETYIATTLRTIERQKYPNLEVIVVDGASRDNTVEVARSFSALQPKIISEPDQGQLDALQKGLRLATGEVCYWLNADDVLMPGTLRYVGSIFQTQHNVDLIFSDDFAFNSEARRLAVGPTIRGLNFFDHVLFYRQMYSECIFWRRSMTKYLGSEYFRLRICTDYAFFSNMRFGLREKWVSKRLGAFREVPGQASKLFLGQVSEERNFIRKKLFETRNWTGTGIGLRRCLHAPRFLILQFLYPKINSVARKLGRILTGDRRRRAMTEEFFNVWLDADNPKEPDIQLLWR